MRNEPALRFAVGRESRADEGRAGMQIPVSREDGVVVVAPVGRIDSTTSAPLEDELLRLQTGGDRRIVVDFAAVDYISSAGLRVMLALARRLRDNHGALALCALNEPVRLVFDLAGFLPLFTVDPSRAAAVARLSSP